LPIGSLDVRLRGRRSRRAIAATVAVGLAVVAPSAAHDPVDDRAGLQRLPLPSGTVARAAVTTITREQYDHWRAIAVATTGGPPRSGRDRARIREYVMEFLLTEMWVRLEAPEHGVTVTDAEADRAFERAVRESFEHRSDFRDFLERSKMSEADARFQIRFNELSSKLTRHAGRRAKTAVGRQRLGDRFHRRLRLKWRARTGCAARYRARGCGHLVPVEPALPPPS
jgi:hypothetical protein